jgi:mycofactocin system glycosyltransferase
VSTALPTGFGLQLDPSFTQLDGSTLMGGSPARIMRLSGAGVRAWSELRAGVVHSPGAGQLARRLTDAGLAHPRPPFDTRQPDVTVVIPVRDRAELLERCLLALGTRYRVIVVDDGSADGAAIAGIAARHGAQLVRRASNGGPGAARNSGLLDVDTELVVFLDSDCVPTGDWIARLAAHLEDPLVGAAAPRITALLSSSTAGRYARVRGSLDLGLREARVVPLTAVAYVPTAALVVRTAAVRELAGFDPALRYGEDVDLIWRLHEAGWRIRYDPAIEVAHHEPDSWPALLARRWRYGTSAAPLARRHPDALAPLVLAAWPTVAVAGALIGSPRTAVLGLAGAAGTAYRTLQRNGLPITGTAPRAASAAWRTWTGTGRYATQFGAPLVLGALIRSRSRRRRIALAALVLAGPVQAWVRDRPALDPARFVAAHVADDLAYGAGVYAGCVRERTIVALTPRFLFRSKKTSTPDPKGSS